MQLHRASTHCSKSNAKMWDVKQPAQLRQVMSDIDEPSLSLTKVVLVRVGRGELLSASHKPSNKIFELISRVENQDKTAVFPQLHCI